MNNDLIEAPTGELVQQSANPLELLRIAVSRGTDIAQLERLMALQERWEANEARKAFNVAFARFKSEAVRIIKNKAITDGPLKGRRYAELFSVVNSVTPALSENGLSASWKLTKDEPQWIEVTCTIQHIAGHSESVSMGGPPDGGGAKSPIQARASTVTYLERYTLKAITGLSEQDDDVDGRGSIIGQPRLSERMRKPDPAPDPAPESSAAAPDWRQAHADALGEAQTMVDLAVAFKAAQSAAKLKGDSAALADFVCRKDTRKAALEAKIVEGHGEPE